MRATALIASGMSVAVLSACEPQVTLPGLQQYGPVGIVPARATADEAATLFAEACLDTMPSFDEAVPRFRAAGLDVQTDSGMQINQARGISGKLTRLSHITVCSVVHEDSDVSAGRAAYNDVVRDRVPPAARTDVSENKFIVIADQVAAAVDYTPPGQVLRYSKYAVTVQSQSGGI